MKHRGMMVDFSKAPLRVHVSPAGYLGWIISDSGRAFQNLLQARWAYLGNGLMLD